MIRIFKLVLLLVVSQVAFGQAPSNYTNINGRYRWIAGMFDSTFHIPKGTTPSLRTGGSTNGGALFYKTADSSLQLYTGTQWLRMLKVGDTTGMLTPYFNSVGVGLKNTGQTVYADTLLLSTRLWRNKGIDSVQANLTAGLATKLNISDTAAMLSPYARTNVVNAGLATKVNISDTSSMLSPYARKNFLNAGTGISYSSTTGTITNTAPDQTVSLSAGTGISIAGTYPSFTITNSSPSSGGTVTSVGSGTGLTGGPITTSGTLAVDTNLISTRLWRQKGVDSVAALANTKVSSVSGTSPISSSGGTSPTISISQASGSTNGFLSSTDWTTFNNKQNALTNPITGTGTTDYIPKFTSSSAIGNSQIFDNGTSVGINTITPSASYKLDVNGYARASSFYVPSGASGGGFIFDAGGNAGIGIAQSGNILQYYTGGSERMRLDASGNLGLGTSSPAVKLDVIGDIHTTTKLAWGSATNGTTGQIATDNTNNYLDYLGALIFRTAAASSEVMRLDASGNLGLGVTPSAWTSIDKEIEIGRAGNALFSGGLNDMSLSSNAYYNSGWKYGATGAANLFSVGYGSNSFVWLTAASGSANAAISFTQAMTLDASGRLAIGLTSPVARLHIENSASADPTSLSSVPTTNIFGMSTSPGGMLAAGIGATGGTYVWLQGRNVAGAGVSYPISLQPLGGNVGIGTTSPKTKVDILSAGGTLPTLGTNPSSANLFLTDNGLWGMYFGLDNSTGKGYIQQMRNDGATSYPLLLQPVGGNVGIGTTTIGSTLQVNGNAAIGYSASTAAPTNGLSISGNTTIGTTTAAGKFTIDPDDNQVGLAITGTSLTSSNAQSLIDLAGTWNTTGNPTALKLNITNTASGASANLMDLQVGGTSQFQVTKGGAIQTAAPSGGTAKPYKWGEAGVAIGGSDGYAVKVEIDGTLYYLMTGFPPEPEPDPAAVPASGPSGNYKTYNKPTPTRSIQDTKIAALEKELAELKEMIKSIKK